MGHFKAYYSNYNILWLILMILLFVTSCDAENIKIYQKNQINKIYVKKVADDTLILNIMPMLETLYSFPGAFIKKSEDAVIVSLVRCRINKKCHVDIVAKPDLKTPGFYNIVLPIEEKPVKIHYQSSKTMQIWP